MLAIPPAARASDQFASRLIEAGLLLSTGVPGLYGRSGTFNAVFRGLDGFITRLGASERAETMRFPPAMNRNHLEASGYLRGFPQLAGTIHCFCGTERDHRALLKCIADGEDWTGGQQGTDMALTPAACYPIYPILAARGVLPETGMTVDVESWCFRHEPSNDPGRMQCFQMREYVRIGTPEAVLAFRQRWLDRAQEIAEALGVEAVVELANDPFFGRTGTLKANSQREQKLKFELLLTVGDHEAPTACMSFNYHQDLFGALCGLTLPDGGTAHTGCVGFGMERLTLALFSRHGFDPRLWASPVRSALAL